MLKTNQNVFTVHLGREDKVILLLAHALGDLMVLGRAGLGINTTINNDPLATLANNGLDGPDTSATSICGTCLRAPCVGVEHCLS